MSFLSEEALLVITELEKNGFEAFAVGGCVRDYLMGVPVNDYDITTNASTDEIKAVFSACKTIDTGIKHGTVTVLVNNIPFEITTYRLETTYSDNRHPDKVIFTKRLVDDLSRRDFTVNSIAYCPRVGFVDPYKGREDIKKRIIRCVGKPEERFNEDSLRILRGIRFASVLGFSIEDETKKAMHSCRHLIKNISRERIFTELSKLLCGKNVRTVLTEFSDISGEFIPEINTMKGFEQHNFHHIYDVLTHTAVVCESAPPLLHLRLAALFHDIGKPSCFSLDESGTGHFYSHASKSALIAERCLNDLRCDNKTKEAVIKLIKLHDTPIEENERIIKRRLNSMGSGLFFDLIALKRADTAGLAPEFSVRNEHFDRLEEMAREILKREDCFSLKHLNVNGNDLKLLGLNGREIGQGLQLLLEAIIDGKVSNKKKELIAYLKSDIMPNL